MKKNILLTTILSLSLFGCSNFDRSSLASASEILSFFTNKLIMTQPSNSYNFNSFPSISVSTKSYIKSPNSYVL